MERIEPETEVHRTQKALKTLLGKQGVEGEVLFPFGKVLIHVSDSIARQPGGQLAIALMVNLLGRMKSITSKIFLYLPQDISIYERTPLNGNDLRGGLVALIEGLSGEQTKHLVNFHFEQTKIQPDIVVSIGPPSSLVEPDIVIGADAWTGYINNSNAISNWETQVPFGPQIAATLGVSEIFKHLLLINFPEQLGRDIKILDNGFLSALTYASLPDPNQYPIIPEIINLNDVAIAGVGAGGSTVVYSLACLPGLSGRLLLADPGFHKISNLGRYLLSTYGDCYTGTPKAENAFTFLTKKQSGLDLHFAQFEYQDLANRAFQTVITTTDTPHSRRKIQLEWPKVILDAAVVDSIYTVLRVTEGEGMCLGCKHPYDPDETIKNRAAMWGKTCKEMNHLSFSYELVTEEDISQLAKIQGKPLSEFQDLVGIPFCEVPSLTECGDAQFNMRVPNQAASLPFVTTMAGILLTAELIKEHIAPGYVLNNWYDHDTLWVPKASRYRYRLKKMNCSICDLS